LHKGKRRVIKMNLEECEYCHDIGIFRGKKCPKCEEENYMRNLKYSEENAGLMR